MKKKDYGISYDNYMNTNAATEVTGLIPSGIDSREEWDNYREIFDFEPVDTQNSKKDNKKSKQ